MRARDSRAYRDFARDLDSEKVRRELRSDWGMVVLYRRPGVAMAWLCARAGIGPMGATLLGFLCALTMPVQALWTPLGWAPWGVAAAGALFQIFDCADGTLARTTGRTSKRGADLEFFADMAQYLMLYTSIGILADRWFDAGWGWTALAAVAVATRFLGRIIRDQVALRTGPPGPPGPVTLRTLPVIVASGLSGLIPFLALTGDGLGWSVWFLVVYALLDVGDALLPVTGPAYRDSE